MRQSGRGGGVGTVVLVLFALAVAGVADAQPVDVPPTWGGTLLDRPRLTGSWFGLRDDLGKEGRGAGGGPPAGAARRRLRRTRQGGGLLGPNAEYTRHVDTQKLGLWPSGFLNLYAITGFGDTVDNASAALLPPNMATLLPDFGNSQTGLMNATFLQFLSPHFGIVAGKIYTLGAADANAFAHDFHTAFMNAALNFNTTLDLFPLSAFGGGVVVLPAPWLQLTASVVDPSGSPTNNDISEAFQDGVLVGAEARVSPSSRSVSSGTS